MFQKINAVPLSIAAANGLSVLLLQTLTGYKLLYFYAYFLNTVYTGLLMMV